jgi:hypothetical protein
MKEIGPPDCAVISAADGSLVADPNNVMTLDPLLKLALLLRTGSSKVDLSYPPEMFCGFIRNLRSPLYPDETFD